MHEKCSITHTQHKMMLWFSWSWKREEQYYASDLLQPNAVNTSRPSAIVRDGSYILYAGEARNGTCDFVNTKPMLYPLGDRSLPIITYP